MSWIGICNIIFVNIIIWLALSYFWSGWNYKVFKPWLWLEYRKRKQLQNEIVSVERNIEDKNRFYAHWFALEQIDTNHIPGDIVIAGSEDSDLPMVVNRHSPDRKIFVVDRFEKHTVEIVRENCQGEVSRQSIEINALDVDKYKSAIGPVDNIEYLKGNISEEISNIKTNISFASIDSVDYDDVMNTLTIVYPLLSDGGIIVVHDYNHNWDSVRYAVDKFEASIPENFIWLPDMYGSVALIKNKKK